MPTSPDSAGSAASELAPPVSGAPVVKQTERPHPLTPLIRGWIVLLAIFFGFFRDFLPGSSRGDRFDGDVRWVATAVAVAVVLAALAGFVSWYFTRFVIDDEELRVETGAVFKTSRKVPFERLQSIDIIQPLAARIFGLAELRLEVGAGDSGIKLRYLSRAKASRLRDYLLARAHGEQARVGDLEGAPAASALTDLGSTDRRLVVVPPQRIVGGFLLSSEFLATAVLTAAGLITAIGFAVVPYVLGGLIPLVITLVSLVGRRVIAMFNFTLAESPRGLRITRGLTNLSSQSVPLSRVQGVRMVQPWLWRRLGWYRVDIDILGYAAGDGENNEDSATSVLLPVATTTEVGTALARVLPGVDLAGVELHPSPRRARWVRWFDYWTLRYGFDERVMVSEHGWLTRRRDIVPHAKTQSVRLEQGPLQRRLRLADVHVDTTKGPVNVVARQLDSTVARELALSQLDRARAARSVERSLGPAARIVPGEASSDAAVLAQFGIDGEVLLGSGGESRVYALDDARVLRIYRPTHEGPAALVDQLRALYTGWAGADIGIEVPQILGSGEVAGRFTTVDRRFRGTVLSGWLAGAEREERRSVLLGFLDAAAAVQRLPSPVPGFARLAGDGAPQTYGSLTDLLADQLRRALSVSRGQLERDLPTAPAVWQQLFTDLAERQCRPVVVHGDICPPNAYVSQSASGALRVSGLGDFSPHTLAADPLIDLTGAIAFLELEAYPEAADDAAWLLAVAAERYGAEVRHWVWVYRRYYGFYFSSAYAFDPALYAWCLRQLGGQGSGR